MLIVIASAYYVAFCTDGKRGNSGNAFIITILSLTLIISIGFFFTNAQKNWKYSPTNEHIDVTEYLPASASNNYLVARARLKEHAADAPIITENDSLHLHLLSALPLEIKFKTDSSNHPNHVIFHRMYFPTWKLHTKAGEEIVLTSDSVGRINALLPDKPQEYVLSLEESQSEKTGQMISASGLVLLAICCGITIFWRNPKAS